MMAHTTLWLSQIQFFLSLGFMAVFAALGLGLAWLLAYFRFRSLGAHPAGWLAAYRFWARVFALALVLSLAAGVAVLIQVASLWPSLLEKITDISSPLLALALVSAFLFKSCFLGAMLFGERRLSDRTHALVVLLVAIGFTLTLFWLAALFSWMQTPAGAVLVDGQYRVLDWREILLNPSMPWLSGLFLCASLVCAAFAVMAVTAWQTLWHPTGEQERLAFRTSIGVAAVALVVQAVLAGGLGTLMAQKQPARAAAVAAYWESGAPPDIVVFGWPDAEQASNRGAFALDGAGASWLAQDKDGRHRGLDQFAAMHPPVAVTFAAFRLAVAAGLLLSLTLLATWLQGRPRQLDPAALPHWWRRGLAGASAVSVLLLLSGLAYLMLGAYPYAVYGSVTLSEIVGVADPFWMLGGIAAYLLLYIAFTVAFLALVRHIARYGVVPVTRHRGRA